MIGTVPLGSSIPDEIYKQFLLDEKGRLEYEIKHGNPGGSPEMYRRLEFINNRLRELRNRSLNRK
jgi:hypothetical protein